MTDFLPALLPASYVCQSNFYMQPPLIPTFISIFIIALGLLTSCRTDELPEPQPGDCIGATPTYTDNIQAIIDQSCAYSGCHLDSAPGVFDTYSGLLPVLTSGLFETLVIDLRDDAVQGMPPDSAPTDRPQDLSFAQIDLIRCWLDAGFPE